MPANLVTLGNDMASRTWRGLIRMLSSTPHIESISRFASRLPAIIGMVGTDLENDVPLIHSAHHFWCQMIRQAEKSLSLRLERSW